MSNEKPPLTLDDKVDQLIEMMTAMLELLQIIGMGTALTKLDQLRDRVEANEAKVKGRASNGRRRKKKAPSAEAGA